MTTGSKQREDHQDLVSGVVGGEPELAAPAARFLPAEPGGEVFEPCPPKAEVELLKPDFVAGDLPRPVHQRRCARASTEQGDVTGAERGTGIRRCRWRW